MARTAGTIKGPSPGQGRNRWTSEQRLCLCMLFGGGLAEFDIPNQDRATIFNAIFKDELESYGLPNGLELHTLQCQYHERTYRHKASWAASWERACSEPQNAKDQATHDHMRDRIAAAITSHERSENIHVATPSTPVRRSFTQRQSSQPRLTPDPYSTPGRNNQSQSRPTPYATPGPSTRKRPAANLATLPDEQNTVDLDDEEHSPTTKRRRNSPTVVIPPTPESARPRVATSPRPSSASQMTKYRSGGRPGATELFVRRNTPSIWLTPAEFAEAQQPLRNVSEADAHPSPSPLLFRFWHDRSHGNNSEDGFVSGRFAKALVEPRPPPTCSQLEWNDVAQHLNNAGMDQTGSPSPFISTSNLLVWTIRTAMKRAGPSTRISVIDTSKLDPRAIFHVAPFYKELKKKRPFYRGGFQYSGNHEHLVWYQIPATAVIKTFSLADITTFANSSRSLKQVLRLDQLAAVKSSATEIIKSFKEHDIKVTGRVANAIGKVVLFLGLDHTSLREGLARAVFEIAQGWALKSDRETHEYKENFVQAFTQNNGGIMPIADHMKLTHAFLDGIFTNSGDLNMHLKGPTAFRLMQHRSHRKGLANPADAMRSELDRERLNVAMYCRRQQRALCGVEEEEEGGEDIDVADDEVLGRMARVELEEQILYE
ncbi:hypothetical protein Q7P37_008029 [Cladosporium fusiforme]